MAAKLTLPLRQIPVSRATFSLTDRNAFEDAVSLAVGWIAKTVRGSLPLEAHNGEEFIFENTAGSSSALRIEDSAGSVWAARTSYHGDPIAKRDWTTELFVERRLGDVVRFGAQLTCLCSNEDPGFDHSRPRVIRDVLARLAGEADAELLCNEVESVSIEAVERFAEFLYNPSRRLPVILVSVDDVGRAQIDLDSLANRLSGTAHLRCVAIEPSFELTRTIGKRMSTFNGAVRVYMPGLEQDTEDPFQHPLWLAPDSGWNPRVLGQVAARVLPLGFRDPDGDARFWRVGLLRQAAARAAANATLGSKEDKLEAEAEALRSELEVVREASESAESLMYEEASKLTSAQADIAKLEEENGSLRERLRLSTRVSSIANTSVSEEDLYSVFERNPSLETSLRIISAIFPDRVVVLPSAYESARDSFAFKHRKKAFELLWSLCTSYWNALSRGEGDVTARHCLGAAYAAREASKLSAAGRKRRTFEHHGNQIEMEKHLKIGVADNKTETWRSHFEWLADEKRIVIGYCGGHLDF